MTLEQQLFALLEQHDLSSLSLHASKREDGSCRVYAVAHGGNRLCAFNKVGDTLHDALGSAIGELNVLRTPPVAEVDALAVMQVAA